MIEAIYKTSWGRYIDLTRINSISEVGRSGVIENFAIDMQLQEKPIIISSEDDEPLNYYFATMQLKHGLHDFIDVLQVELVEVWKKFKTQHN